MRYKKVTWLEFSLQFEEIPAHQKPFITSISFEHYHDNLKGLYLSDSKNSGFGITKENELVALFALPGSHEGKAAVQAAIELGASWIFFFDGHLLKFYESLGFKVTLREAWNDEYAPTGWNYEKYGRPDVITAHI